MEHSKAIILSTLKRSGAFLGRISYENFNSIQERTDDDAETAYNRLLGRVGAAVTCLPEYVTLLTFVTLFDLGGDEDAGGGFDGDQRDREAVRAIGNTVR